MDKTKIKILKTFVETLKIVQDELEKRVEDFQFEKAGKTYNVQAIAWYRVRGLFDSALTEFYNMIEEEKERSKTK